MSIYRLQNKAVKYLKIPKLNVKKLLPNKICLVSYIGTRTNKNIKIKLHWPNVSKKFAFRQFLC